MFTQESVKINRSTDVIYSFLSCLRDQMKCWDLITVKDLDNAGDEIVDLNGYFTVGNIRSDCKIELYRTRPKSGVVMKILWDTGELAAEWRVIDDGDSSRVELNLEGSGGGLANKIILRQIGQRVISRVKSHFELA